MPLTIGHLQRVKLREVWKHEAMDFTHWLENNIELLNEALGLSLTGVGKEHPAGDFSVDLVAEDEDGKTVVIENQLEKSNHDHLGKLITYLTAIEANTAIWIVSDPRPEHVAAITWLNNSSSADFYMVKVEAIRIDESPAAPLFTMIVGPSPESKNVGETKKEIAERHSIRKKWWATLIERSASISKSHAHLTPSTNGWISASAGVPGLGFNYVAMQDQCRVELYIDCGKDSVQKNQEIFNQLFAHREAIEKEFGLPLTWDYVDGRRGCRIEYTRADGGYRSPEDKWPQIQDKTIQDMNRLEAVFEPYIKELKISS